MKNVHNKIVAIALAGVAVGGVVANSIKVYADEFIIDSSSGRPVPIIPLNDKFDPKKYPDKYPKLEVPLEYAYKIKDPKDILPKGNDIGVNNIYKVLMGSGFEFIKISGKRSVIDDFVSEIDEPMLKKPQVCFKNLEKFREYIAYLKINKKPQEGVYRIMLWGYEGLFYFNSNKILNMYDQPIIDLHYIQRGENKYKYKVLDFNLSGEPPIKKYKKPIVLDSVKEFFDKIRDFEKRKIPGHFGSANHGGVQPGGIYCIKINNLVVLFRALE